MLKYSGSEKTFLGLLAFSLVGVGLLLSGIWYLVFRDNRTLIDQILLLALAGLLVGALVIACFGTGGIILTLLYARDIAVARTHEGGLEFIISHCPGSWQGFSY